MAQLDLVSRQALELPKQIADAFVGCILAKDKATEQNAGVQNIAALADAATSKSIPSLENLINVASVDLTKDEPNKIRRYPFHWPLEFPEVFLRNNGGFDAFVGNPPFIGGQRITGAMGTAFRDWLIKAISKGKKGSADLVAYFFLRVTSLLREQGSFGLLATNTVAEGDTRQVGLETLLKDGLEIYAAYPNEKWPGKAAVITSRVHAHKGAWKGKRILSKKVWNIFPLIYPVATNGAQNH